VSCFFDFFLVKNGKMNGNKKINLIEKKSTRIVLFENSRVCFFNRAVIFLVCEKKGDTSFESFEYFPF